MKISLFFGLAMAMTDHENGLAGNAPCLAHYSVIQDFDLNAMHGIQASDGGYIAVGNSAEESTAFVLKTKACKPDDVYSKISKDGKGCDTWDWITTYGDEGKTEKANWVGESPDGAYLMVAGIS